MRETVDAASIARRVDFTEHDEPIHLIDLPVEMFLAIKAGRPSVGNKPWADCYSASSNRIPPAIVAPDVRIGLGQKM